MELYDDMVGETLLQRSLPLADPDRRYSHIGSGVDPHVEAGRRTRSAALEHASRFDGSSGQDSEYSMNGSSKADPRMSRAGIGLIHNAATNNKKNRI